MLVPDEQDSRQLLWEWDPQAEDDLDQLFARVDEGTATETDNELFDACMLDRFISRVYAGESVEKWILEALANAFAKMLMGGEWNDEIRLPGRPMTPIRSARDQRDLEIYCDVANALKGGVAVVSAIEQVAASKSVSYETARAGYYRWRDWLSKNSDKTQKDC